MNRITNIAKAFVGKLPVAKQKKPFEKLAWANEKVLKHQEDRIEKKAVLSGFTIYYKRPYELLHTFKELFEKQIYKFSAGSDKPLIFDCGANIGLSVLYFKQLYPQAQIEAYEPDDQNFEILSRNCKTNGLQTVQLHKAAVWIKNGTVSFDATESEASHVSEHNDGTAVQVPCVRLADALQHYPRIDFLKIDIEGAEWQVVQDIATELHRVENFFLEYHGKAAETGKLNDIMGILKSSGFSVYIKNAADNLSHPFVEKTTGSTYDVQLNIFCYRN